jgi:uncharacterized membrane protein YphA (DoxX/SURF4 family)
MEKIKQSTATMFFFTVLRVLVGWHFLFEGISKLASPDWSSYTYLMDTKWLFAGIFHWIIANPEVLKITDLLNIWGLIFIGFGLFLGLFTRIASISGALLLILYYVANPPFMASYMPAEGHYFIVTKNLVEAVVLIVFASLPKNYLWSIDRMIFNYFKRRKEGIFPENINHEILEPHRNRRREMIKNLAVVPVLGGVLFSAAKQHGWISFEEKKLTKSDINTGASTMFGQKRDLSELKGKVPLGKIKHLQLSRIIPGGNLVSGFAHSRDLIYVSPLIKNYFTDEKVIETLWLYEACGINTTIMRTDEQTIRILKKFWERGGKIQWIAQTYPKNEDLSNIKLAVDNGAVGAFVMGNIADKLVYNNQLEFIEKPVSYIKSQGLIAGVGGHSIKVPMTCVRNGIDPDFFMKTFHDDNYWSAQPKETRDEFLSMKPQSPKLTEYHDNLWCASAKDTSDFFKTNSTPWIAYKVLAAGAINPKDGLKFAFENGADFACIGMFDFQVIENANIVNNTLTMNLERERKWFS